jgi:hypothetical protein
MRWSFLCPWIGTAVLFGSFLTGCSHGVHAPTCPRTTAESPACPKCTTCKQGPLKSAVPSRDQCPTVETTCRCGECRTVVIPPGRYQAAPTWLSRNQPVPTAPASPYACWSGTARPYPAGPCQVVSAVPATTGGFLPGSTVEVQTSTAKREIATAEEASDAAGSAQGFRHATGTYLPDVTGRPAGDATPVVANDGWVVFDTPEHNLLSSHHLHDFTAHDITAHPAFAHATDHRWLVGRLEADRAPNSWTLRYASVDEDDAYGGRVTLLLSKPVDSFHNGDLVRVEGQIANQSDHEWGAAYRVDAIAPLPKK